MMTSSEEMKRAAGEYAVQFVQPGLVIGIGTGTTVFYFIQALAKKVKEGLQIRAVATSKQSTELAEKSGILITDLNEVENISITIDGADEADNNLQLIKGGGGALLQEKMVAAASDRLIIIADEHKYVKQLGQFPLPVEVIPFGWKQTQKHIRDIAEIEIVLRERNGQPFITDHGHYILDCHFEAIKNPAALSAALNNIPGVVENGLFINMADQIVLGKADGSVQVINK